MAIQLWQLLFRIRETQPRRLAPQLPTCTKRGSESEAAKLGRGYLWLGPLNRFLFFFLFVSSFSMFRCGFLTSESSIHCLLEFHRREALNFRGRDVELLKAMAGSGVLVLKESMKLTPLAAHVITRKLMWQVVQLAAEIGAKSFARMLSPVYMAGIYVDVELV